MAYKDLAKKRAYAHKYNAKYYQEHLEERRVYHRGYYKVNKETVLPKKKAYNAEHRDKKLAYAVEYDAKPANKIKANRRKREKILNEAPEQSAERKEKQNTYSRALYARDPSKALASQARRRAQKYDERGDFDDTRQWEELQAAFDHRCAYCGKRCKGHLTRDHITAITKNGPHTLHNIVPACHACNLKKNTRAPLKAVQPLLLTIAPSRKKKR